MIPSADNSPKTHRAFDDNMFEFPVPKPSVSDRNIPEPAHLKPGLHMDASTGRWFISGIEPIKNASNIPSNQTTIEHESTQPEAADLELNLTHTNHKTNTNTSLSNIEPPTEPVKAKSTHLQHNTHLSPNKVITKHSGVNKNQDKLQFKNKQYISLEDIYDQPACSNLQPTSLANVFDQPSHSSEHANPLVQTYNEPTHSNTQPTSFEEISSQPTRSSIQPLTSEEIIDKPKKILNTQSTQTETAHYWLTPQNIQNTFNRIVSDKDDIRSSD